jgi:hypothetical protein
MTRHGWSDDEARALYLKELECAPRLGATPIVDLEALEASQTYVERQRFMRESSRREP